MTVSKISTKEKRYIQALQLAITAPTEEKSKECASYALSISQKLTEDQIKAAQEVVELAIEWRNKYPAFKALARHDFELMHKEFSHDS